MTLGNPRVHCLFASSAVETALVSNAQRASGKAPWIAGDLPDRFKPTRHGLQDDVTWEFPAGEVLEEACAIVTDAKLLGFSHGECIDGSEKGLILVRAIWLARVTLNEWNPQSDERFRKLVTKDAALGHFQADALAFWNCVLSDAERTGLTTNSPP
jgi:hypothetical protein